MRKTASFVAFVLIYLGAANAALAIVVGTCTGDKANSLMGGFFSAAVYALALLMLLFGRPGGGAFGSLIPIVPVLAWQTYFSIKLFVGYHASGLSACEIKMGERYGMDGRELLMSWLWLGTYLGLLVGLAVTYRLATKPRLVGRLEEP